MKNLRCLFYLTTEVYTISDTLSANCVYTVFDATILYLEQVKLHPKNLDPED